MLGSDTDTALAMLLGLLLAGICCGESLCDTGHSWACVGPSLSLCGAPVLSFYYLCLWSCGCETLSEFEPLSA